MVKDDEKEDQDLWQDYKRHEVDPGLNTSLYTVSQKVATFIFYDNFGKREPIFIFFFTVKFRKDLRRKMELKQSPPLKSVVALPCEK